MIVTLFEEDWLLNDNRIAIIIQLFLFLFCFPIAISISIFPIFLVSFFLFLGRFFAGGFLFGLGLLFSSSLSFAFFALFTRLIFGFKFGRRVHPSHHGREQNQRFLLRKWASLERLNDIVDLFKSVTHQVVYDDVALEQGLSEVGRAFKFHEFADAHRWFLIASVRVNILLALPNGAHEGVRAKQPLRLLIKLVSIPQLFEKGHAFVGVRVGKEDFFAWKRRLWLLWFLSLRVGV